MKITFIILAHKDAFQLAKMISVLSDSYTSFVIHIDERKNIANFKKEIKNLDLCRVYFTKKRCITDWGRYGLVQAVLNSLEFLKQELPETDRIILLSGQDYPIKPLKHIYYYLKSQKDSIFLEHFKIPCKKWKNGGKNRFPFFDKISKFIDLYGGSQWMSFPMFLVDIIFKFIDDNPDFVIYFKAVAIPDESFFQTLILNCDDIRVKNNLIPRNLHFIKWDFPYMHPRILTNESFNALNKSKALFARKFSLKYFPAVVHQIDSQILQLEVSNYQFGEPLLPSCRVKNVILFLTNKSDKQTIASFKELSNQTRDYADSFILYHQTKSYVPRVIAKERFLAFNNNILEDLGFMPIANTFIPGSNHFPLFHFFQNNMNYEYYWVIEDDVRFGTNWHDFFSNFPNNDVSSDYLTSHIRRYREQPHWYWWDSFSHPKDIDISTRYMLRAFNPIYRLSNNAVRYLENALKSGWAGHHEVLIPTLLNISGFKINDLGGFGEFAIQNSKKLYTSVAIDKSGNLDEGSMRYRPVIDRKEIVGANLYHPVKIT